MLVCVMLTALHYFKLWFLAYTVTLILVTLSSNPIYLLPAFFEGPLTTKGGRSGLFRLRFAVRSPKSKSGFHFELRIGRKLASFGYEVNFAKVR